jgi:hypothetical protein
VDILTRSAAEKSEADVVVTVVVVVVVVVVVGYCKYHEIVIGTINLILR